MTAPIDDALQDLLDEFELIGDDWEERYRHLIDLGRALPPLPEVERNDHNKVRGCASQVWLATEAAPAGHLRFRGDSDAILVRGLIALLLRLYDDRPAPEIAGFDAEAALRRLGLAGALSAQRSNGLASMVARIRRDAAAAAG